MPRQVPESLQARRRQQTAPFLRLLFQPESEAVTLCACLHPWELAELLCTASWAVSREYREAMWRGNFVLHWGADLGAGRGTQVRLMRSWYDDAWPAPWPLAVGFCGAETALDHLFWLLPFIRCSLHVEKPRTTPPPPPPPLLAWQVACRVRASPGGQTRLVRCFLCDTLEVAPPGPAPQHFRQRWTRPCASCPRFAHRSCLEGLQQAGAAGLSGGAAQEIDSAGNAKSSDAGGPGALKCGACGSRYHTSGRFPESLLELVSATAREWRWLLGRLRNFFVFFGWLYTLAAHYCAQEGVSKELCILLAFTACMMAISVSQRFHRGIQMIWNTPHRWLYFQLFFLFAALFYLVSLRAFNPQLWAAAAVQQPWLAGLWEMHAVIHGSFLGTFVLSIVSCLYVATASGVIFLFWKTALRVPTVADEGVPLFGGDARKGLAAGHVQCGLCQLGLCLDNTCM